MPIFAQHAHRPAHLFPGRLPPRRARCTRAVWRGRSASCAFLDEAAKDAAEIHPPGRSLRLLVRVQLRGAARACALLGKLAELTDRGIPVHLFIGNHDMWIFDYLPKETGVMVHREADRARDQRQDVPTSATAMASAPATAATSS
jgi:hypothetical protein